MTYFADENQTAMKNYNRFFLIPTILVGISCSSGNLTPETINPATEVQFTKQSVAKMFSDIPLDIAQLEEVYNAVSQSCGSGYDEEYTLTNLMYAPGAGVGQTKAPQLGGTPLRDMIASYLMDRYGTKAGGGDVEKYLNALGDSDFQIYWPNSDEWDGRTFPIVTFDPGLGAESNYGYEISYTPSGVKVVDSVFVDEKTAMKRPVWVINSNVDRNYKPVEYLLRESGPAATRASSQKQLVIKDFTMLRNYDSWFAGASEFVIKAGFLSNRSVSYTQAELMDYYPEMTDMMLSVKRKDLGRTLPMDALLVSGLDENMENMVFMITEDDGGPRTSWKCAATVKIKSKSYGIDIELPYNENDDIVWRGNLAMSFFDGSRPVQGRFSDVKITFALE